MTKPPSPSAHHRFTVSAVQEAPQGPGRSAPTCTGHNEDPAVRDLERSHSCWRSAHALQPAPSSARKAIGPPHAFYVDAFTKP